MSSFTSFLDPKHGFHVTYNTQLIEDDLTSLPNCTLHLLHVLPALVFVDSYELQHRRNQYHFTLLGESNLELPLAAVNKEGLIVVLDVNIPERSLAVNITVSLPLHARYGELQPKNSYQEYRVPWPIGFWACPSARLFILIVSFGSISSPTFVASNRTSQPWPALSTQWPGLFGPQSTFVLISPTRPGSAEVIRIPTGHPAHLTLVQVGTFIMFLLVFVSLLTTTLKISRTSRQHTKIE